MNTILIVAVAALLIAAVYGLSDWLARKSFAEQEREERAKMDAFKATAAREIPARCAVCGVLGATVTRIENGYTDRVCVTCAGNSLSK